jgi:membrane protein DedA with SNARE-associated domain
MSEIYQQIQEGLDIVFAYGPFWVYLAILIACFIENIFPPFPGDTFIVAAGALVAFGRLDPCWSFVAILGGGLASTMVLYYLGWRYGRSFFLRKDYKYFSAADILKMEANFAKRGAVILIFSRFVVGMRAALAIAAGISRYRVGLMLVFSAMSYLLFAGLLMLLAHKLVENIDRIEYYLGAYQTVAWVIVIAVMGLIVYRKVAAARKGEPR